MNLDPSGASFRDRSGFVFERGGELYRHVGSSYAEDWSAFQASGLYDRLISQGLIVKTAAASLDSSPVEGAIAVLKPELIKTISYPYEWSFSQLKDAAILTLDLHEAALQAGMTLKDASAYNVQFHHGKPIFIDTLSFARYVDGEPWIAYGQFCRHFFAPLALMSHVDPRISTLSRNFIDGIPLDLAAHLLPGSTKLNLALATHIHAHAKATTSAPSDKSSTPPRMPKIAQLALVDGLRRAIMAMKWEPKGTVWGDYYDNTNYSRGSFAAKRDLVRHMIQSISPKPNTCWDLGANTGEFSRVVAEQDLSVVAWDFDPAAVEQAYLAGKRSGDTRILPLIQDFSNPSPRIGWANRERFSFQDRASVDVVLALALIHHLAIGNNVPLPRVIDWFAELARWAIVEFVPKTDSQVVRMLSHREDVFDDYHEVAFECAIERLFDVVQKSLVPGTERTLYLLKRRD